MYDRPNLAELIDAARLHMEANIAPAVRQDHKLYFQTLVAINVLKIAERELAIGDVHSAEAWHSLNQLEGVETDMPNTLQAIQAALGARNTTLSADIRAGKYDEDAAKQALFEHVKATTIAQLQVANPRFLEKLAEEDTNPDLDAWHNR